ncbi:MAG: hypothetical protein KJ630_08490 [Proteobacteria bacterium]|nr:hypothetical protein [Pseudomonadota bacterium]
MLNSRRSELTSLLIITGLLISFRTYLSITAGGPTCFPDEILYRFNATAIFELGKYSDAHYPPFYSLIISPALFFQHWYEGMLVIGSLFSCMVVPATWFLARALKMKNPFLPALISALLPMHAVYSQMLLSENIGMPLFVFAVALAFRGSKREAIGFGLILGLLHLTKYLYLPAVILLFVVWIVVHIGKNDVPGRFLRVQKAIIPSLMILAAYIFVYGLWLCYGVGSGISVNGLFGFQITPITTGRFSKSISNNSFVLWSTSYLSYIVIAWLPSWVLLATWCANKKIFQKHSYNFEHLAFVITLFIMLGGYWLLAVQHSFGASYNYPIPHYLLGRYLMHLSPLVIVFGFLIIENLLYSVREFNFVRTFLFVFFIVATAFLMRWILFDGGIWGLPHWFADIPFNSIDAYQVGTAKIFVIFVLAIFVMLITLTVSRNHIFIIVLPWIAVSVLILFLATERAKSVTPAIHSHEISKFLLPIMPGLEKPVNIYISGLTETVEQVRYGLEFWGVSSDDLNIEEIDKSGGIINKKSFIVVCNEMSYKLRYTYKLKEKKYFIYQADVQESDIQLKKIIPQSP